MHRDMTAADRPTWRSVAINSRTATSLMMMMTTTTSEPHTPETPCSVAGHDTTTDQS